MNTLLRFWVRQRKVRMGQARSEPEPGLPVSDGGACLPAKPWQECSWSLRLPTSTRAQALARMLLGMNRGDSDSLGVSLGLTFQNSAGSEGDCRKEPTGCTWMWERRKPSTFWRQGRGLEQEAGGEGPDEERWKRKELVGSRVMASTNILPLPEETHL